MGITLSPALSGDAAGYYCTQADLESRYLAGNVAAFSNLGRSTTGADTGVIQAALDATDIEIDTTLRGNGFDAPVPTTSTSWDAINSLAIDLAWTRLLKAHTYRDPPQDGMGREMFFARKQAMSDLKYLARTSLDCPRFSGQTTRTVAIVE